MNIFALDINPKQAAEWHVDKHVVKMPLESAQMLCTVLNQLGVKTPYKSAYAKHPCTIWAGESMDNFIWLCELGLELCKEYTYRYGKRHKSQDVIEWCITNKPNIVDIGFTTPPKAMPDEYKVMDVVESYRNYYIGAKKDFCVWKNRDVPEWFSNTEVFI